MGFPAGTTAKKTDFTRDQPCFLPANTITDNYRNRVTQIPSIELSGVGDHFFVKTARAAVKWYPERQTRILFSIPFAEQVIRLCFYSNFGVRQLGVGALRLI